MEVNAIKACLLQIQGLSVTYSQPNGVSARALENVHLGVRPGEVVGILGESGCGKSTPASSVVGLLPPAATIESGTILFQGYDLLALPGTQLRHIRGQKIALVPQEPALALNPVLTAGTQIAETLRVHLPLRRTERSERVTELLKEVGF